MNPCGERGAGTPALSEANHLSGEDVMVGVEGKLREGCGGRWNKEVPEMVCLLL